MSCRKLSTDEYTELMFRCLQGMDEVERLNPKPVPAPRKESFFAPMGYDDYFYKGEVRQHRESFEEQTTRVAKAIKAGL